MKSSRTYIIQIFLFFIFHFSTAQNWQQYKENASLQTPPKGKITGQIHDAQAGHAVEYAAISLYKVQDSTLVTGTVSNDKGRFEIEALYGEYNLKIEFISYNTHTIKNIILNQDKSVVDIGKVLLSSKITNLSEVEVSGEKNQVHLQIDKKVFNVEKDLSNIGGTAQDVLENVPSVSVDMDGKVSLRGSENVKILIDGKPSVLTGIGSASALDQLPASSIESIEIITNPSAKYDAEGIAGIINIVLKREQQKGLNGLLNLTGAYPHDNNASAIFNYAKKKINVFGSYNISYAENPGIADHHRETTIDDSISFLDQNGEFNRIGTSHNIRFGLDYKLNDKNTLSGSALFKTSEKSNIHETRYRLYDYVNTIELYSRKMNGPVVNNGMDYSLNFKKLFYRKAQILTVDAKYSTGNETEDMRIIEEDNGTDVVPTNILVLSQRSLTNQIQDNLIVQADYVQPLNQFGKLETGYKSSFKKIDKDYTIEEFNGSTGNWDYLSNISNHFIYSEDIHAVYGIYSNGFKNFNYQLGLRTEQSIVNSKLQETGEFFEKKYLNLFPTVHLTQEIKNNQKLQFSYSRRINRPSLHNLNPFNSYADPLNLWVGNPDLNPEFTHSLELSNVNYWEKSNISSSIYYKRTDGVIQRIRTMNENGVSITQPMNLSTEESFGVELNFSNALFKWWKINGNLNYFRSIVDGTNLGKKYTGDFYSWTGRINSMMTVWKNMSIQVMFNYRGPSKTIQGTRQEMYFADIGIKKDILKEKASISFRVSDIFNTRSFVVNTYGDNFYINTLYSRWTRRVYVGFSYKINRYKPKEQERKEYEYEMDDAY